MELTLIPARPLLPLGAPSTLPVLLRLAAPAPPPVARKPLNLCLVIDRSGSMAGEKLRQTIASARFVVERLAETDLLSVVQFDERVRVVISPRFPLDRARLGRRLDRISPGGSTNLSGGWLRGAACLREHAGPEWVSRLLLLTDGQANHGITDPERLVRHAAELTEEGITTTTLGYGAHFNEELLTALADAGRGAAYHVETADQAPAVFARELAGLLAVAAQNVRVRLLPGPLVRRIRPRHAVEARWEGAAVEVGLGDLYGGEARSLLVELEVEPPAAAGPVPLLDVRVAYDGVGERIAPRQATAALTLEAVPAEAWGKAPVEGGVMRESLLVEAGEVLRAAIRRADAGDLAGACRELEAFLGRTAGLLAADPEVADARQKLAGLLAHLRGAGYDRMSRKQMLYSSRDFSL